MVNNVINNSADNYLRNNVVESSDFTGNVSKTFQVFEQRDLDEFNMRMQCINMLMQYYNNASVDTDDDSTFW